MTHPIFDNQGYRKSNKKNFSPMKFISSNLIDTTDMSVPAIVANGQTLYNNTGTHYIEGNGVIETPLMKDGGKIKIKESNKGKFTAYKERTGKTTEEALHSKDPKVRKMANFAKNAKIWSKKQYGGFLNYLTQPMQDNQYGMYNNNQINPQQNLVTPSQNLAPDTQVPQVNMIPAQEEYQRGFGVPNKSNILGIGALQFGLQTIANDIDNRRQQDYINQQNDPYSNLVPISGQSQGVKYGYMKDGGNVMVDGRPMYKRKDGKVVKRGVWSNTYLSKKQDGGEVDDDFDPEDFLWGDEKTNQQTMVSDIDVREAELAKQQQAMKRQQRSLLNQQAMAIVDAPYTTNTTRDSTPKYDSTNSVPYSSGSYKENIAAGESGGDYLIQNPQPGQTAFGKYQFVKGTRLGVYNQSQLLKDMYKSQSDFEEAFTGKKGLDKAKEAQELTMDEYTAKGVSVHKNDPVAMSLYHYAPKFADLYMKGKLDLDKNAASYGVGKGVKNPSFRSFLRTHGFKGQFSKGGTI